MVFTPSSCWNDHGITTLYGTATEHVTRSCEAGAEVIIVNKVGRRNCEKCSHTFARMQGSIKESNKCRSPNSSEGKQAFSEILFQFS